MLMERRAHQAFMIMVAKRSTDKGKKTVLKRKFMRK